jgi:Leucine-rich repeat (LRR) protein
VQVTPTETFTPATYQQAITTRYQQNIVAHPLPNSMVLSWLPLYGYQNKLSIAIPPLPLQIINTVSLPALIGLGQWLGSPPNSPAMEIVDILPLPAEVIEMIQSRCSHKDLLALTSVNKAAFASRFHHPRLQQLRFTHAVQVTPFLAHSEETPPTTALHTGAIRTQEDFKGVKVLALTVSEWLKAEHCAFLFSRLSGVTHLRLSLAEGQTLASLTSLFKAASHLTLTQLTIEWKHTYNFDIDAVDEDALPDTLPDALWQCHTLKKLALINCGGIKTISEEMGQLTQLVSLVLQGGSYSGQYINRHLTVLPKSLRQLTQLEELFIQGFSGLTVLPSEIGQLTALTSLHLRQLDSLKALPTSLSQLKLEELSLWGIKAELLSEIGQLTTLKSLELTDMSSLKMLPASLGMLTQLEKLSLVRLNNFTALPSEIGQLTALTSLTLYQMQSLKALPASLGQLTRLEKLTLWGLPLTVLPNEIGQLTALTSFKLHQMQSLEALPASLRRLENLQAIFIDITSKFSVPPELERYIK